MVTALSLRIGFSGAPGAGKSTLIETLGKSLTQSDHRVAVLVRNINPSSIIHIALKWEIVMVKLYFLLLTLFGYTFEPPIFYFILLVLGRQLIPPLHVLVVLSSGIRRECLNCRQIQTPSYDRHHQEAL